MRRTLTALALMLGLPLTVFACLWDRDTPAVEAKGMPEVVAALTGRFARNPPLYYAMRLERVASHLQSHPEDLAAYDDAGVACDRLGRGDEAIAWMEKERAQLDKLDVSRRDVKEHEYRYHANLGTFLVHRWVREGADRARIAEVKSARDEIAKALEINPKAHFGREKYQLKAIEWIIDPPKMPESDDSFTLPNLLGFGYRSAPKPQDADDAVKGLSGLIVLGNAWESVDIFYALGVALGYDSIGFQEGAEGGRNSLAHFARLRCVELIDAGKGSMLLGAPKGDELKSILHVSKYMPEDGRAISIPFAKLRAEADAWQLARTEFMNGRLKEGRHPDTDPHFWDGYQESPPPSLPGKSQRQIDAERMARNWARVRLAAGVATMLAVVGFATWRYRRSVKNRGAKLAPAHMSLD